MKENSQKLVVTTATILIVAILAIIVYTRFFDNANGNSNSPVSLDYNGQPVIGDSNAPVKVVLFEDFLCPHCASFTENVLPRLKRKYANNDKVAFFFINFPLGGFGAPSIISALASECAYEQNNEASWELKTVLMRSQNKIAYTAKGLAELAEQYVPALNVEEFETCIEENRHSEKVSSDRAMASSVASATPTVLVNGEATSNAEGDNDPSFEIISSAIEQALNNL